MKWRRLPFTSIDSSSDGDRASLGRRLLWMLLIWTGSVAALGCVAYGLRMLLRR